MKTGNQFLARSGCPAQPQRELCPGNLPFLRRIYANHHTLDKLHDEITQWLILVIVFSRAKDLKLKMLKCARVRARVHTSQAQTAVYKSVSYKSWYTYIKNNIFSHSWPEPFQIWIFSYSALMQNLYGLWSSRTVKLLNNYKVKLRIIINQSVTFIWVQVIMVQMWLAVPTCICDICEDI